MNECGYGCEARAGRGEGMIDAVSWPACVIHQLLHDVTVAKQTLLTEFVYVFLGHSQTMYSYEQTVDRTGRSETLSEKLAEPQQNTAAVREAQCR